MVVAVAMSIVVRVAVAMGMRVHAPDVAAFRTGVNSCVIALHWWDRRCLIRHQACTNRCTEKARIQPGGCTDMHAS